MNETILTDHRTRVFMFYNARFLVLLRDFKPNVTVLLPGGGIDPGETSLVGVKREIKEEINFDVTRDPTKFYTHHEYRQPYPDELRQWEKDHPNEPYPYSKIEDVFDFYIYQLSGTDKIGIPNEEKHKFEHWGFIYPHELESYAKRFNATVGVGIKQALKIATEQNHNMH